MWRRLEPRKSGNGTFGEAGGPAEVVAVAVDADRNSQHALKWAADHVIPRGKVFVLLHVRKKILTVPTPAGFQVPISEVDKEVATAFLERADQQTKELLLPFQCFCNRRGLQCKEVILEDVDIPKAIIDFICHQTVGKLVMGASSRNAFIRTFKATDVPTSVSRIAPDFCSVYVISKGKISSVRPATKPNKCSVDRPLHGFDAAENRFQSTKSEPVAACQIEIAGRSSSGQGVRTINGKDWVPCEKKSEIRSNELIIGRISQPNCIDHSYLSTASCPSLGGSETVLGPSYALEDVKNEGQHSRLLNVCNEGPSTSLSNSMAQNTNSEEVRVETMTAEERANTAVEMALREKRRPKPLAEMERAEPKKIEAETNKGFAVDRNFLQEVAESGKMLNCLSSDVRYRRYSADEIQSATGNFSNELKIGEGGYGPVFRSTLDHTLVAIKVIGSDASQGMKQFQREVELLSTICHPNMVQLMGACPEYGCLVYEFMANGSLEDRLFCHSNTPPLSWQLRFKIASEIATGLLFLHQTKPEPIVHRDLKPGNILLDHNFVSKIADVGLARLIPHTTTTSESTQYHMTAAAGTFCYIDPEYQKTGMLGIKSDVYALGIILLQLITAAPPVGLAHNVEMAIERGKFESVLDPRVPDWPMEETRGFAELALQCAELRRRDRPDLGTVVLPELNKLSRLADLEQDSPVMHHPERSKSCKEPSLSPDVGMDMSCNNVAGKGPTSFSCTKCTS